MNNPLDPTLRGLDDCGCCAGTTAETPVDIENRPGLDAIAFRAGTQPQFKASLLASLTAARNPALKNLKTRDDDDFTIALLESWATVADVLTFYSERIANESYLRTATERRSILELARSIGYELNPGVAASTWLAFTVEDAPGAPGYANIEKATQVQSIPGPSEKPQVFETLAPLFARAEWNLLRPRAHRIPVPYRGMQVLRLKGTTTGLRPGDALLVIGQERENDPANGNWDFQRASKIETFADDDPEKCFTLVTLDHGLKSRWKPTDQAKVFALRTRANFFGYNAPSPDSTNFTLAGISGAPNTVHLDSVYAAIVPGSWLVISSPEHSPELFQVTDGIEDAQAKFNLSAKTTRLSLSGGNLAQFDTAVREASVFAQSEELPWAPEPVHDALYGDRIVLDKEVPELPAERELLISGLPAAFQIAESAGQMELASAGARQSKLDSARFMSLTAPPEEQAPGEAARWQVKLSPELGGALLAHQSQFHFVAAATTSAPVFETAIVKRTEKTGDGSSRVILTGALKHAYDPTTMVIHGNVAFATHGETTSEILGSGDATHAHQRFFLKQAPLTYIPAANPSGGETTLQIWVNDVRWTEVPTLFGRGPRDRVYVVRIGDDGIAAVLFGDGRNGARLPTGHENVRALYRKGTGRDGLLKAGQLSLLMTRPLGLKSVTNPQATEGGVDPQVFADARVNAPTTVLTLDRVVSQQDYEDFARNFSGVAKALATWTWNTNARGVFLTVAGIRGATVGPESQIRKGLLKSLRDFGKPFVPVEVKSYTAARFRLGGTVFVESDRIPARVEAAVKEALKAAFSFEARSFGQPVTLSEVEAVIQNVPGVAFVDLDTLHLGTAGGREPYLPAHKPAEGAAVDTVSPAELLTLDESSLSALKVKAQ